MLNAARDMFEIERLKAQLNSEFDMKNLRAAKKILGWKFTGIGGMEDCFSLRTNKLRRC